MSLDNWGFANVSTRASGQNVYMLNPPLSSQAGTLITLIPLMETKYMYLTLAIPHDLTLSLKLYIVLLYALNFHRIDFLGIRKG